MKVLDVQNLNVQYHTEKGNFDAVSALSLSIEEGEITGLVGQSGCGKSTAVRAIMGISAENAEVEYENLSLDGEIPVPGHNIAMIFQDSQNCLNPSVKIGKQIAETVKNRRKCTKKEAVKRALELLDLVGIRNPALRMKQYPFELSGGQRQRVVIAIALACDPRLIVADEPTTALDGAVQAQILGLLRKVVRETKTALLLVSHDLGVIASLCSRVYVMEKGQVVESGTAEEIFYSPEQEYTKQLIKNAGKMHFRTEKEKVKKEILLRTEHLTKEYHTKEGVRDLSFELYKGETFALVGESGSGKTTLARVLSGILKSDSGMIDDRSKNRAQMVFQDPYGALNPCLTVGQALEEAIRKTVPDPWLRRQKAEDILRLSGLRETVRNRYPRELSGGERQRAGIARALVCDPELLIADEMTTMLDLITQGHIWDFVLKELKRREMGMIAVSHSPELLEKVCDRVVRL